MAAAPSTTPTQIRHVRSSILPDARLPSQLPSNTAGNSTTANSASFQSSTPIALPLTRPVVEAQVKISSMDALALRLMREHEANKITIVGDARRNSIWLGTCTIEDIQTKPTAWRIVPATEAANLLADETLIATPHGPALDSVRDQLAAAIWIKESQYPDAMDVAGLAALRHEQHATPEPLTPLYLHAAV